MSTLHRPSRVRSLPGSARTSTSLKLPEGFLDRLARKTGFLRRKARKITPSVFFHSVVLAVVEGFPSLRSMAIEAGLRNATTVSKQALWERISTPGAVAFVKACAQSVLEDNLADFVPTETLAGIGRILVGDSSGVKLHHSLAACFPGGRNERRQSAQLRLQCTLDLITGQWIDGGFEPYLRQDAEAAHDLVDKGVLQKGDLVIRDLGYAVIDAFARIARAQAFFLSRLHPQWSIHADGEGEGCEKLDLLELLRSRAGAEGESFRLKVRIGGRQRFPCQLVAVRVPAAVADSRRRRARETARRKGVSHTRRYLALLDWTVMVTNVEEQSASTEQLLELYRLRWRVEMFFKLCKSHTPLEKIATHRTNRHHAEVMVWAWLYVVARLSGQRAFAMAEPAGGGGLPPGRKPDESDRASLRIIDRSIFKIMPMLLMMVSAGLRAGSLPAGTSTAETIAMQVEYHNGYERRSKRVSLPQRLEAALDPCSLS